MKWLTLIFVAGFALCSLNVEAARIKRQFFSQSGESPEVENRYPIQGSNFGQFTFPQQFQGFNPFGGPQFPGGQQFQGNQGGQQFQGQGQGQGQGGQQFQGNQGQGGQQFQGNQGQGGQQFQGNQGQGGQQGNLGQQTEAPPSSTTPVYSQQVISCRDDCTTRTTGQYNPVCGSDGENYPNQARLECARDCGVNVSLRSAGVCQRAGRTTTPATGK